LGYARSIKTVLNERHLHLEKQRANQLSLVMPIHGPAPFLKAAIRSVFESQNVNIDFILVLDRCTNLDIQEAIRLCPPNIEVKVIHSNSPGIVPALNLGIANARYDLIARLDSDDLASPARFHLQLEFLKAFKEVVCVGTQMAFIDEAGNEFGYTNYPTRHLDILDRMMYQNCIGHPSVMFRKSIFQQVGGYREFLSGSEDYDLWLRLSEIGELANLPIKLTKYRKSQFQVTNQIKSTQTITDSACLISAAMRKLNISENPPKQNHLLFNYNLDSILKIQAVNPIIAREIKAAGHLNNVFREWSKEASTRIKLLRTTKELFEAGWNRPGLVLSFISSRLRFHSVRVKQGGAMNNDY
jgi:glycosyltransferase involved in cell wall biosynthesis